MDNFVSLAAQRWLLVVIHHHKSYLVQVKKNCVNVIIESGSKPMQVSCKGKRLNQSMTWKAAKGTWNNLGDKRVTAVA